jgi:FkbM family methyltransferase
MRLRQLLKFVVPYGVVELVKNRRRLGQLGRRLKGAEWLDRGWLMHETTQTGLDLFPPGFASQIKYVVDVGANEGQWSGMLLDCLVPERLIIIEPGPAAFAQLQKSFGGTPRISLHQKAIGATERKATLKITRDTTGASLLQPKETMRELIGGGWAITSEVEVPVTTLDRLLTDVREISLLKIDVQGLEMEVLAGATETLKKTKFLLMELNYMPQYEGGSWFGPVHEKLTQIHGFFLANASKPLCLNGRAAMCDGLYVNPKMVPKWVAPDFV